MAEITPIGKRLTKPQRSFVWALRSRGMISPPILLASSDAILNVFAALSTSVLDALIVFPLERVIDFASSSFLFSIPEDIFSRT